MLFLNSPVAVHGLQARDGNFHDSFAMAITRGRNAMPAF